MITVAGAPVVVGVDSSAGAQAAVRTAAREARLRHRPLRIVHAFLWPSNGWVTTAGWTVPAPDAYRDETSAILACSVNTARRTAPEIEITGEVIEGAPASVLLAESQHAALVVVGSRGGGGFPGMLIGSTAGPVAAHAASPVLVVRGHQHPDGPVVVGVDGSRNSMLALDFAAEEAALRGAELVALHTWCGNDSTELNDGLPMSYEFWAGEDEEKRVLAEALAGVAARYPGLRLRRQVRLGSARQLLRDWSLTAQMVVVGSRGHGGFVGLLLGSVGHHLLLRADCPTAVVRPAPVEAAIRS